MRKNGGTGAVLKKHEILMEKDAIRNDFIDRFYALIKESIIDRPETLKPF